MGPWWHWLCASCAHHRLRSAALHDTHGRTPSARLTAGCLTTSCHMPSDEQKRALYYPRSGFSVGARKTAAMKADVLWQCVTYCALQTPSGLRGPNLRARIDLRGLRTTKPCFNWYTSDQPSITWHEENMKWFSDVICGTCIIGPQ